MYQMVTGYHSNISVLSECRLQYCSNRTQIIIIIIIIIIIVIIIIIIIITFMHGIYKYIP